MNDLQLNNLVSEIKFFENQAVVSYWEIGKRLKKAKEQVGHGEWLDWLNNNLNYSANMAQKLIRVSSEFSKEELIPHLSFAQALALTTVDEETREKIIENENLEDKTVKETKEIIKKYKEEAEDLKEENEGLKRANQELTDLAERLTDKEPEIIEKIVTKTIEVMPKDYDLLKKENERLTSKITEIEVELVNARLEKKKEAENLQEKERQEKVTADINDFVWNANSFIGKVGGLLYLTDYLEDMNSRDREVFIRSVKALNGWTYQLNENIKKWRDK